VAGARLTLLNAAACPCGLPLPRPPALTAGTTVVGSTTFGAGHGGGHCAWFLSTDQKEWHKFAEVPDCTLVGSKVGSFNFVVPADAPAACATGTGARHFPGRASLVTLVVVGEWMEGGRGSTAAHMLCVSSVGTIGRAVRWTGVRAASMICLLGWICAQVACLAGCGARFCRVPAKCTPTAG